MPAADAPGDPTHVAPTTSPGQAVQPRDGSPAGGGARLPVAPLLNDLAGWGWRLLVLGVVAWVALRVAERVYLVSLALAAAVLFTALLSPGVARLRRRGVPRGLATAVVVVVTIVLMTGVLAWVVDRAVLEFPSLVNQLSHAVRELPFKGNTLEKWREDLVRTLESHRSALTQGVLSGLATGAKALTGVLLTFLLTLILLADGDRVWGWIVDRFPPAARPRVGLAGRCAYARLSGWIRGTVVIALFHGVVVAAALVVMGVPLVAPLAILVFFGSFIPIVGALIFGGIAVLVTLAAQGLTDAIVLTLILIVDNQFEAHALQPFLVGRYVKLHPFAVALTITAGALIAGFAGALLAVPFTAAVYAALTHLEPPAPRPRRQRASEGARRAEDGAALTSGEVRAERP